MPPAGRAAASSAPPAHRARGGQGSASAGAGRTLDGDVDARAREGEGEGGRARARRKCQRRGGLEGVDLEAARGQAVRRRPGQPAVADRRRLPRARQRGGRGVARVRGLAAQGGQVRGPAVRHVPRGRLLDVRPRLPPEEPGDARAASRRRRQEQRLLAAARQQLRALLVALHQGHRDRGRGGAADGGEQGEAARGAGERRRCARVRQRGRGRRPAAQEAAAREWREVNARQENAGEEARAWQLPRLQGQAPRAHLREEATARRPV